MDGKLIAGQETDPRFVPRKGLGLWEVARQEIRKMRVRRQLSAYADQETVYWWLRDDEDAAMRDLRRLREERSRRCHVKKGGNYICNHSNGASDQDDVMQL